MILPSLHNNFLQVKDILVGICTQTHVCKRIICMYSMHVYISGSGTFALLRYIYVQAFGYCRFLEKLENTLHSQEPIAVSEFFLNFYV